MYPVVSCWAKCLKNHNLITMYPLDKCTFTPSVAVPHLFPVLLYFILIIMLTRSHSGEHLNSAISLLVPNQQTPITIHPSTVTIHPLLITIHCYPSLTHHYYSLNSTVHLSGPSLLVHSWHVSIPIVMIMWSYLSLTWLLGHSLMATLPLYVSYCSPMAFSSYI